MAPRHKKEETGELMVSIDQYTRTRDSVILSLTNLQTGLAHVQNGLNDLLRAYMQHTSSILAGEDGDLDKLQLPPALTASAHAAMEAVSTAAATANGISQAVSQGEVPAADGKKKRKREKKERDPNAPKKPLTAAFLYAQSARPIVRSDLEAALQPGQVLEKNAVNLETTKRWNDLPDDEKEKWKASYRKSMEEWKVAMADYLAKIGGKAAAVNLDDEVSDEGEAGIEVEADAIDSEASSSDEDEDEPPKAPSPPAKSRPNKRQKTAANGAAASASTPIPVPSGARPGTADAAAGSKKDKKKKAEPKAIAPAPAAKELSPEESTKAGKKAKSSRTTRGTEAEVDKENAATPTQDKEKKKRDRSKRKSEATS